jgi:hypothetical protein
MSFSCADEAHAAADVHLAHMGSERSRSEPDVVVVSAMHVQGAAYRSGKIKVGDIVVSVNGENVESDTRRAANLIRGVSGSMVQLGICRPGSTGEFEVALKRSYVSGHPTNEAPMKARAGALRNGMCCNAFGSCPRRAHAAASLAGARIVTLHSDETACSSAARRAQVAPRINRCCMHVWFARVHAPHQYEFVVEPDRP